MEGKMLTNYENLGEKLDNSSEAFVIREVKNLCHTIKLSKPASIRAR